MRAHGRRRRSGMSALALVALTVTALLLVVGPSVGLAARSAHPSGSARAAVLSWSASENPVRSDASPEDFGPVSCASVRLCVAVSLDGDDLVVSTHPADGPSAWSIVTLPRSFGLSSVSCPSAGLCVVGDGSGNVWVSTDPTGGFRAWHRTKLETPINTDGFSGMSCPTTTVCVASDDNGNIWASADPAGGRSAWHHFSAHTDPSDHANNPVSCASASLCVLLRDDGRAYVTGTPLRGGWHATGSPADREMDDTQLSCVPSFCLAGGTTGPGGHEAVHTSRDPSGPGRWKRTLLPPVDPNGWAGDDETVSCVSAASCVMVDLKGHILASSDPGGGAGAWHDVDAGRRGALGGITCVPASASAVGVCLAFGDGGHALAAPGPTGPWRGAVINGWSPLTGVACPTSQTCLAVDGGGNVLRATIPRASGSAALAASWSASTPAAGQPFSGVACLSMRLCLAGGARGSIWEGRPSAGGAGSWRRRSRPFHRGAHVNAVSCPSRRLCAAVDTRGAVATTTDPTSANPTWTVQHRLPALSTYGSYVAQSLTFVTCPSARLCLAGDRATPYGEGARPGMLLSSDDPSRPASWHGKRLAFGDVACPTASLCVATDGPGRIAYSHHPSSSKRAWHRLALRSRPRKLGSLTPAAISCAGPRFCAIGGKDARGAGIVTVSRNPTVRGSWHATELTGSPIAGVYCRRGPLCIATSQAGEIFVARHGR